MAPVSALCCHHGRVTHDHSHTHDTHETHDSEATEAADRRWLPATWPFVRAHLPSSSARVLEIGCGVLGGFVPELERAGYDVVGVDPEAPSGSSFRRTTFEEYDDPRPFDAAIACTSLHHVADLDLAFDKLGSTLAPSGRLVVVEWVHELFDEPTARWCFDRLPSDGDTYLHHHRDAWAESGLAWDDYFRRWAQQEHGLHPWTEVERALGTRFTTEYSHKVPYYFPTLGISEDDELAAIRSGTIRAGAVRYVGRPRG
jgi:SAM-dependent methyltransferase